MTAEFGTPAPLPGQPGFRTRPSESMARETAEMEERLARLKTDLAAEAEMREASGPRKGGARWRSARTDRGSVRAYAKDVKTRHKQQLQQHPTHGIFAPGGKVQPQAGAGARAAAALRDEQQQRQQQEHLQEPVQGKIPKRRSLAASQLSPQSSTDQYAPVARLSFESKEVCRWGVGDTLGWLDSLGLGKHKDIFQQNEISGPILLEVGLDDLDYMSICVLAHRKRILKGIEELRRKIGKSHNPDKPPPPAPPPILVPRRSSSSSGSESIGRERHVTEGTTAAIATSAQRVHEDLKGYYDPSSAGRGKQHWSTVKPLAENQTEERDCYSSPSPAVNLADGQYDEVAAHSDFAQAVAEWRGTDENSAATKVTATTAKTSAAKGAASSLHRPAVICRAPVAGILGAAEEEREISELLVNNKSIGKGLFGGRGEGSNGGAGECWTNPFGSPREGETVAASGGEPPLGDRRELHVRHRQAQKGRQKDFPHFEEEAEHEAFRRAVADWNRSGIITTAAVPDSGNGGFLGRTDGHSSTETATIRVALPNRRTAEAMAEELREQMDAEHRLQAKDLEEKKKALLTGFGSSRQERHGIEDESGVKKFEENSICKKKQEVEEADMARCSNELGDSSVVSSATSSFASLPACSIISSESKDAEVRSRDGDSESTGPRAGWSVEIEIVESVLGATLSTGGGMSYLVDEDDSDDDLNS